jgi:hypothetical protein
VYLPLLSKLPRRDVKAQWLIMLHPCKTTHEVSEIEHALNAYYTRAPKKTKTKHRIEKHQTNRVPIARLTHFFDQSSHQEILIRERKIACGVIVAKCAIRIDQAMGIIELLGPRAGLSAWKGRFEWESLLE